MAIVYTRYPVIWDEKTKSMRAVTVDIEIDIDELAKELARRTNRSKSGKSCIFGKIIIGKQRKD